MEIIDLPAGQCIEKAGFYRTPLSHYHTQAICPGPSISSSGLRDILKFCPQYFWRYSELNPDAYERTVSHFMVFGSAAHALLLGDEVFEHYYVVSPHDKFQSNVAKMWKQVAEKRGLRILRESDMVKIREMSKHLNKEPIIRDAKLFEGDAEVSMIWQDRETGVWLKSRPDMVPNSSTLADLKATVSAHPKACYWKTEDMRYDIQMSLGRMGMRELRDQEITDAALLYCEYDEPYLSYVQEITVEDMELAEIDIRKGINTFADCLKSNEWHGYGEGVWNRPGKNSDQPKAWEN